jgi:hypothetical protein
MDLYCLATLALVVVLVACCRVAQLTEAKARDEAGDRVDRSREKEE